MTIVVGIATPAGLVLAGDSRTTFSDGDRHRIMSDNAQKVFAVGKMGVVTSGHAFIGRDTIAGVMDQFIAQVDSDATNSIDSFAPALGQFFNQRFTAALEERGDSWDAEEGWPIGFLAAGYDDRGVGHIREVLIPGPAEGEFSANTTAGGVMWRGQTDVIGRLLNGIDWQRLDPQEPIPEDLQERLKGLSYLPLSPITIQDGVDYASFLVRTTIDMQRFSDGTVAEPGMVPGCGGPIQALAVERGGVTWSSQSTLAPSRAGWAEGAQLSS